MTEESKLAEKLEDSVTFSEDELNKLKEIQEKYASIQIKFGQIGFAKIRIENEIAIVNKSENEAKEEFATNQKTEEEFIKEITKKYGEGMLDPNTGKFILNK